MAGYFGYSKSNNAIAAEAEGKLPKSRAIAVVARQADCTLSRAREAVLAIGPCEWHHTSKRYNATDYFCVAEAVGWVRGKSFIADLPDGWTARLDAEWPANHGDYEAYRAAVTALFALHANEYGVSDDHLQAAYYETWESFT